MARDIWLRKNYRPFMAGALLPAVLAAIAAVGLAFGSSSSVIWLAGIALALAALALVILFRIARLPRLSYRNGSLEVFLSGGKPICVPIEIVECFFLGQGPSLLPKLAGDSSDRSPETATLIVRLAESAVDWKHRDVRPALGQWCEGYITIRGTFSESLGPEIALKLNRKLVEAQRSRRPQDKHEFSTIAPRL